MTDFRGKSVLITGGNKGLGAGVARGFLAAGADLMIAGLEPDVAETAALWSAEFGRSVRGVTCDIAWVEDVARLAEAAGTDGAAALARAQTDPAVKEALRRSTDQAAQLGLFGAPSFTTEDGELFWGNDRLEDALDWASGS